MKTDRYKPMIMSKKTSDLCMLSLTLIFIGIQAVVLGEQIYVRKSGKGVSDNLEKSYTNSVSRVGCGATCLKFNCSWFAHNNVTKECTIYSKTFNKSVGATSVPVSEDFEKTIGLNVRSTAKVIYGREKLRKKEKPVARCEDISPMSGNGVYKVYPSPGQSRRYYCYRGPENQFWNVIQYRYDGSLGFHRTWDDYKNGFGSVSEEFWLGNDEIHRLTTGGDAMLRIEMEGFNLPKMYAQYNSCYVDNEQNEYKLTVGSYHGTAGDGFKYQNGLYFSTIDRDNDDDDYGGNCEEWSHGGYWCKHFLDNNLNGLHGFTMVWRQRGGTFIELETSRMMVRKK